MKTLNLGLLTLLTLFLFVNCEQEQALAVEIAEPSEEQIAKNYLLKASHLVLFAALEVDHEDLGISGYILDKKANLKKVEFKNGFHHKFDGKFMSDDIMRRLHEGSTYVETVDPIVVAEMLKKSYRLANEAAAELVNESIETSKIYYGFKRNNEHEAEDSCGPGSYDHGPTHHQLLIHADGRLAGQNSDEEAILLLDWLKSFEDNSTDNQGK